MEDFQTIKPSPILAPYVKHYWFLKTDAESLTPIRTVPTGHISLMFHRGRRIFSASENDFQPQAFLCGHEKAYTDLQYSGSVDMICVVFNPVGGRLFFGMPMSEINGLQVDINDLGDIQLEDLEKSLADTTLNQTCVLLIEQFLTKRMEQIAHLPEYNLKRIGAAIKLINSNQTEVNSLAEASCLSYKQFSRIFTEYIGAKPKDFLRIIRFQRALFFLQTSPQTPLAQLAAECGYYDQSHLIKEFRTLSGYTPVEYVSVCAPFSDYFS